MRLFAGVPAHVDHQHVLRLEGLLLARAGAPPAHETLLVGVDVVVVDVLQSGNHISKSCFLDYKFLLFYHISVKKKIKKFLTLTSSSWVPYSRLHSRQWQLVSMKSPGSSPAASILSEPAEPGPPCNCEGELEEAISLLTLTFALSGSPVLDTSFAPSYGKTDSIFKILSKIIIYVQN